MIEGRLGNIVICQAQYNQIANTDFNQIKQGQFKHGQSMERSKILFGVSNPVDLVEVKIYPPSFKGIGQNTQVNLMQLQRNYLDDLNSIQILDVTELEKIKQKSHGVRNRNALVDYQDDSKPKIRMTDSVINDGTDENVAYAKSVNQVYNIQTNHSNF